MRRCLVGSACLLALAAARAQDGPVAAPRTDIQAPSRVPLHDGAAVGDTLERTVEQRGLTQRERTTIVAREQDGGFVVERTGPAWGGLALRLVVDAQGRTRAAFAGAPGARSLVPVSIGEEAPEEPEVVEATDDLSVAGRALRCERRVTAREEPMRERSVRWVVAEGPLRGVVLAQETSVAGHTSRLEPVSIEETTLRVGARDLPCVHIVRRPLLDGLPSPPIAEWVARAPVFFGETLLRLDNGLGVARITALGTDGRTVFPDLEPRPGR